MLLPKKLSEKKFRIIKGVFLMPLYSCFDTRVQIYSKQSFVFTDLAIFSPTRREKDLGKLCVGHFCPPFWPKYYIPISIRSKISGSRKFYIWRSSSVLARVSYLASSITKLYTGLSEREMFHGKNTIQDMVRPFLYCHAAQSSLLFMQFFLPSR